MGDTVNVVNQAERGTIMQHLSPARLIPIIVEQMLGIKTSRLQDASKMLVARSRYNKPVFTEEFVRILEHTLHGYVNDVTTFTKYDETQIRLRILNIGDELTTLLAITGNDGFVSENSWNKILRIHDSKKKKVLEKEVSMGWSEFGINWTYNDPVTSEMLAFVKDFDESVDQEVVFTIIASQIRRLIESCYRRSGNMPNNYGMMTGLLADTHSTAERYSGSPEPGNDGVTIREQEWT